MTLLDAIVGICRGWDENIADVTFWVLLASIGYSMILLKVCFSTGL